ncbi:MAG: WD40 repeat domain-containing protein, partial [Anaerolineales bacterium]
MTPTTIPATPTPVPPELAVIAPDNAAGVQQVAQVGLGSLTHVSTSPDGKWLAVGSSQGIRLYDLGALDPVGEIATGPNAPRQIFFSPDGRTLAALMDGDESVHVWDLSSGQPGASPARTLTWTDRAAPVLYGVTFSPDWRVLAWVARGTVQLMDVATGQLLAGLGHEDFVQQIAFSPDGKLLATSFGGVKVWDVASGQELQTLIPYPDAIGASLTFSPDGATLVTASGEGTTKVWDVVSGQEHLTLTGVSASFSPDGEMLATTSGEGKVSVWNVKAALESGSPNAQVAATLDGDNPVFSPDGGTLAVKADETTIRLVDVASGQERQTLSQPAPVDSFEFLPDGNRLRVTLADQTVALWDAGATNGQPLWSLSGFMGPVQALAFSPDGKTLASGSTDRFDAGTIRVWELTGTSGAQTLAWRAHADAVQGLAYA